MKWNCEFCNEEKRYNRIYDCYYCQYCNAWLEEKCTDSQCQFCPKRPEKPLKKAKKRNET